MRQHPYEATAIANEFIRLAASEGRQLTPSTVQKFVYLAHGWYLALYEEPLIDELIVLRDFGALVQGVYDDFKYHGNDFIDCVKTKMGWFPGDNYQEYTPGVPINDIEACGLIEKVWKEYKNFDSNQLHHIVNAAGTPSQNLRSSIKGAILKGQTVSNESIMEYFKEEARKNAQYDLESE